MYYLIIFTMSSYNSHTLTKRKNTVVIEFIQFVSVYIIITALSFSFTHSYKSVSYIVYSFIFSRNNYISLKVHYSYNTDSLPVLFVLTKIREYSLKTRSACNSYSVSKIILPSDDSKPNLSFNFVLYPATLCSLYS